MADRFILSHIKRLPLFAHLTPGQLEWVADIAQVWRFNPGDLVIQQGRRNDGLLLFVSGSGALTQVGADRVERNVGPVTPGQYVNESALFVETTASVSLRVAETSIVLFVPRQDMLNLLTQQPELKSKLRGQATYTPPSPGKVFKGQRENETVLIQFRRHRWVFLKGLWLPVVLAIFLWVVAGLIGQYVALIGVALAGLGLVAPGILAVINYVDWRNDQVVISDQRVVHTEHNFRTFETKVNQIDLGAINEVATITPPLDPAATLLGYGTLIIRTASDTNTMKLDHIPNPKAVQNIIFTNRDRFRESSQQRSINAIQGEIDKFLGRVPSSQASGSSGQPAAKSLPTGGWFATKFVSAKGETVYRKHILVWLRHITWPLLLALSGLTLFILDLSGVAFLPQLGELGLFIALLMAGLGLVWSYLADWDWRNDLYIVGDQVITLIHKRPLWLQNEKDEVLLARVDNVVADTRGLLNNLFQFGDVRILLTGADAKSAKVFKSVHRPEDIQEEIAQRKAHTEQSRLAAEAGKRNQEIARYLEVYHRSTAQTDSPPGAVAQGAPEAPPQVRDASRPPRIPRVRGDGRGQ
jgi:hypothetical protein